MIIAHSADCRWMERGRPKCSCGADGAIAIPRDELDRLRAERDDWKGCTGALKSIKDAKEKDLQAEIDRLRAEVASLKAEIDWHVEEIKRLRQKLMNQSANAGSDRSQDPQ